MRDRNTTYIKKKLSALGKDPFGLTSAGTLSNEYEDLIVTDAPGSDRDEIFVELLTVSIDAALGGTPVHEVWVQGSLNGGTEFTWMKTITTPTLSSGSPTNRQVITIPWSPAIRLRMKDFATENAVFFASVLI